MNTIDTFLASWKEANFEYYTNLLAEYLKLRNIQNDVNEKYGNKMSVRWALLSAYEHREKRNTEFPKDFVEARNNFEAFNVVQTKTTKSILMLASYSKTDEVAYFNEILDKEVIAKKAKLINRIEKQIGDIKDTHGLHIGNDGNINGLVIGEVGSATVRTIYAGGYDVQCLHFRVLVKVINNV